MEDREIVELFWARDESGIKAASEKFTGYCMRIAQNILGSKEDSEDCVNDILWRAWENIPPHRPENLGGFLGKLTRNLAITMRNKKHAAKRGGGEYELVWDELSECVSDKGSIEAEAEIKELNEAINGFLKSLPPMKRNICVLRYSRFEKVSDIAEMLGVKESYVLTTLSRTRKKLKEYLIKKGFEV